MRMFIDGNRPGSHSGLAVEPNRARRRRQPSIPAVSQEFPEFRCQVLIFTGITLLHPGQVGDHLFGPLRGLTRFNRLNIVPELDELPDRPSIRCSGRPFPEQLTDNVGDTAKLLPVTVLGDNILLCFR